MNNNEMEVCECDEIPLTKETLPKSILFDESEKNSKIMKIGAQLNHIDKSITSNGYSQTEEQRSSYSIKVYLRLKPYPREMKLVREQESAYQILDQQTVLFNLPKSDHSWYSNKGIEMAGRKFRFSQAFDPSINQGMIFEHVIKPELTNFFGGQNCTVMAYGTSDSGKSYTLEGSFTNPGLIPRTLQHIFFLKNPKASPSYKPIENKVEVLSKTESSLEIESRKEILSYLSVDSPNGVTSCSKALKRLDEQLRLAPVQPGDIQQEVWVSYAEIRDEIFYDLLSPEYNQVRYPLKLVANCEEQPFVKDLRYVSVGTAAEAWDTLIIGRNNLRNLNMTWDTRISKSHCIFNVVLLEYHDENDPEKVQISRFSFCDLAAQESPNIDSSLLSLTKSLKAINNNQSKNVKTSEYFCPSKLTRLFQKSLTGEESLSLVVNVNPLLSIYKETMSVLYSTCIDTEIVTKSKRISSVKLSTKFGKIIAENIDNWDDLTSTELEELSLNFKGEIAAIKVLSLRTDIQAREKIINKYTAMIERLSIMQKKREKNNPPPEKKHRKRKSSSTKDRLSEFDEIEDDSSTEDDELKIMVQKMRTQKQMMQRELTQVELQLNNILTDVNVNNSEDLMNAKDLALIVCDKTIECRNNELRINSLIGLLNEAKNEITKLCNEVREKDKKYSELEKKNLTIKLNRESDSIIHSNTNYAFKVKCEILENLEDKLHRERDLRQLYQDKAEKLNDSKSSIISPNKINKVSTIDQSTSTDIDNCHRNDEVSTETSTDINSAYHQSLDKINKVSTVDQSTSTDFDNCHRNNEVSTKTSTDINANSAFHQSSGKINEVSTVDQSTSTDFEIPHKNDEVSTNTSIDINANSAYHQSSDQINNVSTVDQSTLTDFEIFYRGDEVSTDTSTDINANSEYHQSSNNSDTGVTIEMNDTLINSTATSLTSESDHAPKVDEIYKEVIALKSQIGELFKKSIENNDSHAPTSSSSNDNEIMNKLDDNKEIETKIKIDKTSPVSDDKTESSYPLRRSTRKRRCSTTTSRSRSRKRSRSGGFLLSPQVITCDNCDAIIIDGNRYHCSICRNDDFDLCPECFEKIGHVHAVEKRSGDI